MSNFIGVFSLLGVLPFLFFFWRKLRDDYSSAQIFGAGFYMIFFILLFAGISIFGLSGIIPTTPVFSPTGLWFWGSVLGFVVGLTLAVIKLNVRFFETFEAASIGLLYWLGLVFIFDSIKSQSTSSLISFGVTAGLIGLFYFLNRRYKKFTWYRSGKIGFSGLATVGVFFLLRSILAFFFPFVLTFVGRVDALISGSVSFILFLLLYSLAES